MSSKQETKIQSEGETAKSENSSDSSDSSLESFGEVEKKINQQESLNDQNIDNKGMMTKKAFIQQISDFGKTL